MPRREQSRDNTVVMGYVACTVLVQDRHAKLCVEKSIQYFVPAVNHTSRVLGNSLAGWEYVSRVTSHLYPKV